MICTSTVLFLFNENINQLNNKITYFYASAPLRIGERVNMYSGHAVCDSDRLSVCDRTSRLTNF